VTEKKNKEAVETTSTVATTSAAARKESPTISQQFEDKAAIEVKKGDSKEVKEEKVGDHDKKKVYSEKAKAAQLYENMTKSGSTPAGFGVMATPGRI